MKVGIIAEDLSDVSVIKELTLSMISPKRIRFCHFVGHGCGKLRKKCRTWAELLANQDCPWLVVVHDLDHSDERELRAELAAQISLVRARAKVVLLPKREIEAWLLYDAGAIANAFGETIKPRLIGNPEALLDPKDYLDNLVSRQYGKKYLSTIHNERIAHYIDVRFLANSRSFSPHPPFVMQIKSNLR